MKGVEIVKELTDRLAKKAGWNDSLWALRQYTPLFYSQLVPLVHVTGTRAIRFYVAPDYWCLGEDDDYLVLPMSPLLAAKLGRETERVLPTPRLVNLIYSLGFAIPSYPQSKDRQALSTYQRVNAQCHTYLAAQQPRPALLVGHRKDIVVCSELARHPKAVAIYGWHGRSGKPIQPLYCGHSNGYYDYSHGTRFLSRWCEVDGVRTDFLDVFSKPDLWPLVSKTGPVVTYPVKK